ncbi:MAG: TolC family protein [Gemmatimonadota bacterium]|nr:TolC family protein [Gemmatimonadota bacterium]
MPRSAVAMAWLALALGIPREAAAQAASASPLNLGALLDSVERANPLLTAARASARAAAAMIAGAKRPPDPQLQIGWMNYVLPDLRPMESLGMTQLQAMQMLPLNGKLRLAGEAATARADASAARVAGASFDLRARGAMAFYDLYATDGALDAARDTRRLLVDVAAIAARMYEVGEGRQADVLRANVELARMDEDIIRMGAMRYAMAARLNALQLAPDSATVGEPAIPLFPAAVPPLDSLTRLADAGRPMLRAAAQDVRAAESRAELARRELWPDLQVGVQLGRQGGAMGPQTMGSLMVGASVPVFAGSRQLKMREEADAMRAMADADLVAMRVDTHGAIAEALANLTRARRLAVLYRRSVLPQAEATVTSSLAAYRVGDVNLMTLLDAQMTLNRYRQELFTLEADEGKAWAELEMLTGHILVEARTAQPLRRTGGSPR